MLNSQDDAKSGMIENDLLEKLVFALDIGTRSVIGVVGVQQDEFFNVIAVEREMHASRSMIDGQIEDIEQVAKVAGIVKKRLEEKVGVELKNVCVAAAGRALKTCHAVGEIPIDLSASVTEQLVSELEMKAIENAYEIIKESIAQNNDNNVDFYCVGHSVVKYFLDDYPISNLINHKGKQAKAEVIATFLPSEVLTSLYAAMEKIALQIVSLTLEPIAAINAVIPKEIRLLNLALVDVGAGTSDIAISENGSVVAYTMATVAGDEVTELIIKEYLVDFDTAEKMKTSLEEETEYVTYEDILGFEYSIPVNEFLEKIKPAISNLCSVISEKILEVNQKIPAAVFLVGGGSKMPFMCECIADELQIDRKKVAIGGNNYLKRVTSGSRKLTDPEYATPMGIAVTAAQDLTKSGCFVYVNKDKVKLLKNHNISIMDVLLLSGYQHSQIIGRLGKNVTFELNGERKIIRGGYPQNAEIYINEVSASISTPVKVGDNITILPAVSGKDAAALISEVTGDFKVQTVALNGIECYVGNLVTVNGSIVEKDRYIKNLDVIKTENILTVADLCQKEQISLQSCCISINGIEQTEDYILNAGDDIELIYPSKATTLSPQESQAAEEPKLGTHRGIINVVLNGKPVELYPKQDFSPYYFVDMLNFVDIDPSKPQGNIVLKINGKDAAYLQMIADGDKIEIFWEKENSH